MLQHLRPQRYVNSAFDIDGAELAAQGIRGVISDLDNTLVEWNSMQTTPRLLEWLQQMRDTGLSVCLVSNGTRRRVEPMAETLGLPAIHAAGKPRRRPFREAMRLLGTRPEETVVIGDQIFTDVFGGNRLGLYTILVRPVAPREFFGTTLVRAAERWVLYRLGLDGPRPVAKN